ncbi:MAG: M2 family metallopeptidase [Acidobacteria bacterium]|nr:M2 family metallopeptidase [Acidobacteriota bacterium]
MLPIRTGQPQVPAGLSAILSSANRFRDPVYPGHNGTVRPFLLSLAVTACAAAQTQADAAKFLESAETRLLKLANAAGRAGWIQSTYITSDTEALAADTNEALINLGKELARTAAGYDKVQLPADMRRKMNLLKNSLIVVTPSNPAESTELTRLMTGMEGAYGRGKYCRDNPADKGQCLDITRIERILAESRDPRELLDVWQGWHSIARPLRNDYSRFVELANKGARQMGFADSGAMWRAKYDMPPDAFARELDRLWEQVRPLYVSLHAYVRGRLRARYGDAVVPAGGPIPAHLLGNLWQQSWENVEDLVAPAGGGSGYDLTKILRERKYDETEMVRGAERFFTSLGFEQLPKTFWDRSLFRKPADRDVVCHASAWDVDNDLDLRIKMCIQITAEEFAVIHHELGHNIYQRAYRKQPFLFRDSANDGFHEAVGDTIALSVTPEYLVKIGLLDKAPDASRDIGLLMGRALEKVAFLPFGLLIDQWRWKVFAGEIKPDRYNASWWELKRKYQGVAPAGERGETEFDPAAKYHVSANVPYTRYFLAHVLQFQFHRALARAAGCTGPLHRCSIYADKEAGRRLAAMLEMGASRPWQDALQALTGSRQMDATAMLDYFAPLKAWLDEQNKGNPVGW